MIKNVINGISRLFRRFILLNASCVSTLPAVCLPAQLASRSHARLTVEVASRVERHLFLLSQHGSTPHHFLPPAPPAAPNKPPSAGFPRTACWFSVSWKSDSSCPVEGECGARKPSSPDPSPLLTSPPGSYRLLPAAVSAPRSSAAVT